MAFIDTSIVRDKRNEVFSEIEKAWSLIDTAIGEKGFPDIVYIMRDGDKIPDGNKGAKPWARVAMLLTSAKATSISQRRYTNYGNLSIEIFVKTDNTASGNKVELLADFIKQWLRRYRGSVLLKNIAIESRPNQAGYSSAAITAAFEYQEFNSGSNPK